MQQSKKLKEKVKEASDIKEEWESMKKEIDSMKTALTTVKIEVDKILKALGLKSYGEEFRERMEKAEKKNAN
jgi:hypothetical protein